MANLTSGIRACAFDRGVGEAPDPVQFCFVQEVQQGLELRLGLPGKTDDEGAAQGDVRAQFAPTADASQRVLAVGRALHQHLGQRSIALGVDAVADGA